MPNPEEPIYEKLDSNFVHFRGKRLCTLVVPVVGRVLFARSSISKTERRTDICNGRCSTRRLGFRRRRDGWWCRGSRLSTVRSSTRGRAGHSVLTNAVLYLLALFFKTFRNSVLFRESVNGPGSTKVRWQQDTSVRASYLAVPNGFALTTGLVGLGDPRGEGDADVLERGKSSS